MSEVVIGNLALSFLGDEATVSSITPPEGSDQAEHLEQFYPIARDALLEMHAWPFATRRSNLTLRDEEPNGWVYSYDRPDDCLKVLALIPQNSADDYSVGYPQGGVSYTDQGIVAAPQAQGFGTYQPQKFATEVSRDGDQIILTNLQEADARWVKRITDTTKFSPLFIVGCAKLLSSFVAGPIYKGKTGVQMAASMMGHFQLFYNQALLGQGTEGHEDVSQVVGHIAGR